MIQFLQQLASAQRAKLLLLSIFINAGLIFINDRFCLGRQMKPLQLMQLIMF